MSTCPHCHGRGHNPAFIDTATGGHYDPALRCSLCGGSGQITAQQADWLARGRVLREARVARTESLHQLAQRLGISPAAASGMEHGRADPAPLEAAMRDSPPPCA